MKKRKRSPLAKFFSNLTFPDKILFSLLGAGAVVEELADYIYEEFGVRPTLRKLYFGDNPYFKRRNRFLGNVLSKFIKDKLVIAEGIRGQRSFKLSREGLDGIFSRFPKLKYVGKPWDGYWRIVVYDIAETKKQLRSRLRKELKKLGYKFVQKSVWVSPFSSEENLETFLKKEKLWGRILVFKTKMSPEESRNMVIRYWRRRIINLSTYKSASLNNLFSDSFLPEGLLKSS